MARTSGGAPASVIPFRDARNGIAVAALDQAVVHASSAGLGSRGVGTEIGFNPPWETNDLTIPSHYIAMNTGSVTLRFERRGVRGMESVSLAPGQFWLQPAGEPFSHQVRDSAEYGAVALDLDRVARTIRAPLMFAPAYGVHDPVLNHLAQALLAETYDRNPGGPLLAEGIATAMIAHLARRFGTAERPERGGLPAATRRRVLEYIDAHLGESITLAELAGVAGLTLHHFAREFKHAVGAPPHEYVMARRVDRAKQMLRFGGMALADVTLANGFSDQAHFTRVFRKRVGLTPGAYARARQ
ncbi:MAG TPA: AraC family transcriptional regulator [Thermoanaerobaculia bacterium]